MHPERECMHACGFGVENLVPTILNGVVFIILGLYMMKSGVKRKVE